MDSFIRSLSSCAWERTDLCFPTLSVVFNQFFWSCYVTLEAAWMLNLKLGRGESSGQKILALGNPIWVSCAVDYFAWQNLPGSEWELLMGLSFMVFEYLMWWWKVLGVIFKEGNKKVKSLGKGKLSKMQCDLMYYFVIGLKYYRYVDLYISCFCENLSVLLVL